MHCDPRITLCFQNDKWNPDLLNYYFKGLCVLSTTTFLTCVGHAILSISRRGMKLNLANQLTIYRTISSFFFVVGSFVLAYHKTTQLSWLVELFHYLAYGLAISVNITLASFLDKLRQLQRENSIDNASIQQVFYWIERTPWICMAFLTPVAIAAVVFSDQIENSTDNSYLIFIVPAMITQCALIYLVTHHRTISRNLLFKNVRVVSSTVRKAFIFLCVIAVLDIIISTLQLALYHILLEADSAIGWVIVNSLKYFLYAVQVASLAGILCNSDFSENGFNFLKEVAVVELKVGTSQGAVIKKMESSSEGSGFPKPTEAIEVNVLLSKEMTWWTKPPKSFWDVFQFPNPVNELDSRLHSCFTISYVLLILISDYWIGDIKPWYLYLPLVYGYTARMCAGPNLDPQAWLIVHILSPLVAKVINPEYVPGPPKRFANLCGSCVSWLAFILYLCNQKEASFYILCMLLVLASLQTAGMCLGCFVFHIMILANLIPKDTCEVCKVKFTTVDMTQDTHLPA